MGSVCQRRPGGISFIALAGLLLHQDTALVSSAIPFVKAFERFVLHWTSK